MSDDSTPSDAPQRESGRGLLIATAITSLLLITLLLEAFCQVYARWMVFPFLETIRERPRYFYSASENPILGYELEPETELTFEGRQLRINRYGIREFSDGLAEDKRRVAILGDSVVFGVAHSQEDTISALVQQRLDPSNEEIKVLNFSVPGYGLAQLLVLLQEKNRIYDVNDVVYLLNFNDFARHDSIYEGADNGRYRTYVRPTIMSLFFIRKAVYRTMKGQPHGSERWYRWLFEGNEKRGQAILLEMARYARAEGFRFGVALLPSGVSFTADGYGLRDVHKRLTRFFAEQQIPNLDPFEVFGRYRESYFDPTDHFLDAGNQTMASLIAEFLRSKAFRSN